MPNMRDYCLFATLVAVVAVCGALAADGAEIMWTRVIALESGRQCSWPSVAMAADGSITLNSIASALSSKR